MTKKSRLLGIDLCRGLAIYAVVLLHSGDETWNIPIDSQTIHFRLLFDFGVPFFLATSFYFMTAKPEIGISPKFWKSRIERILIVYGVWSGIYLISRISIFSLTRNYERLHQLLNDPLSLIYFGGASYHLYFLPLLFSGSLLMVVAPYFTKQKIGTRNLLLVTALSIVVYSIILDSGNAFQLGPNIAFRQLLNFVKLDQNQYPLIRLLLVQISWIIRCLPYFFIAISLHQLFLNSSLFKSHILISSTFFIIFIICNTFGWMLPRALNEVLLAYTLLIFGISISSYLKKSNVVSNLGICSYGIYLIHPFVMNIVKTILAKLSSYITDHISILSVIILSISCFFLSWLIVVGLTKNKTIAKYAFGIS